ncbi:MAG: translation initiation factor IF-2 [Alphaproteobacteria bacterium]|nr:translation initiation factor IF-2 [Alphaproteobacteria bacterium]MBU0796571.1 translation initiation factor IF-2 [Alphaproteobacteria bacterium]MBU0886360.1 translation initiation factor IF-2 [Alphaproteobacteria bacterium]MBU1813444.1 translation initiation factor IF-2 [Alphaproteobacteria bacterium]
MSKDTEQEGKKVLSLSGRGRLSLNKNVEAGQVRQSFSHGRSKAVTVEVKRKRGAPGSRPEEIEETAAPEAVEPVEAAPAPVAAPPRPATPAPAPVATGKPPRQLTAEERAARTRALAGAKQHEDDRPHAADEPELEAAPEAVPEPEPVIIDRRTAEMAEMQQIADAEAKKRADEDARLKAEDDARKAAEEAARPTPRPATRTADDAGARAAAKITDVPVVAEEDDDGGRRRRAGGGSGPGAAKTEVRRAAPPARRVEPRRRGGKVNINQALDDSERQRSLASVRRQREREKQRLMGAAQERHKVVRDVIIPETITVQELANRMAERGTDVVKALMRMGVMATINQPIDADTAELLVGEFGHIVKRVSESDVEFSIRREADGNEAMQARAPVVTIMGHVDHGKTSLLDALRKTDVAAREAGGITQHIGAYQVNLPSGQRITFLDTPGHEAFTAMRARGANVTDLVVLVVAADDGIMAQTVEAITHAKAAKVPIIVAVNKIDKPGANSQRVRQELLQHELVVEELGGDILCIDVSAKTGENLDKLEEAILLQAEILDLKANAARQAEGTIVEARVERGRGSVATVLIQRGTVNVGDVFVAGAEWGRVRALLDDKGTTIESAGPSVPVEVLGLNGTPQAGDEFIVVDNENTARDIAEYRQAKLRQQNAATSGRGTLEQMFTQLAEGAKKELSVIIKSDVQGSTEAIRASLEKLENDEVAVRVLSAGVGGFNESDVTLAKASNALMIGFNVRANPQAREMARRDGVEMRYYSIIYNVVDDVKALLGGMLSPVVRETHIGNAAIREVFNVTKVGKVAGCMVTEGTVKRGAKVRLLRDNVVIHEGTLKTLRRFKDEVREVNNGYECGMAFENYENIQPGDVIECFEVEEVAREM